MENKKGFTLIELLAVIVVLGIIMLIAVTSVSSTLEKSRKNSFVATARAYISAVKNKIMIEEGGLGECGTESERLVYLDKTMVEKGGIISPYNRPYTILESPDTSGIEDLNENPETYVSHVLAGHYWSESLYKCVYEYLIFLSDGVYSIGSARIIFSNVSINYVEEKEITTEHVSLLGS